MTTATDLEVEPVVRTSEYDYRVLYLSGTWTKAGGYECGLRGTIFVQKDGAASGSIYWRAVRLAGQAICYFGTEIVCGNIQGQEVELVGQTTERGFAIDEYKISLVGGEEGNFGGRSLCHEKDWRGVLDGHYVFRNRKA